MEEPREAIHNIRPCEKQAAGIHVRGAARSADYREMLERSDRECEAEARLSCRDELPVTRRAVGDFCYGEKRIGTTKPTAGRSG